MKNEQQDKRLFSLPEWAACRRSPFEGSLCLSRDERERRREKERDRERERERERGREREWEREREYTKSKRKRKHEQRTWNSPSPRYSHLLGFSITPLQTPSLVHLHSLISLLHHTHSHYFNIVKRNILDTKSKSNCFNLFFFLVLCFTKYTLSISDSVFILTISLNQLIYQTITHSYSEEERKLLNVEINLVTQVNMKNLICQLEKIMKKL